MGWEVHGDLLGAMTPKLSYEKKDIPLYSLRGLLSTRRGQSSARQAPQRRARMVSTGGAGHPARV